MDNDTAGLAGMSSRRAAGSVSDVTVIPPQDTEAEQAVLGACMFTPTAVDEIRQVLEPEDFYRPAHETIWRALLTLRAAEAPTDPIALGNHLAARGELRRVGDKPYLHQLASIMSSAGAGHYARIVREKAELRRVHEAGIRLVQRALEPGADPAGLRTAVESEMAAERERSQVLGGDRLSRHLSDGWDFVTQTGADTPPLWGSSERVAWSSGEALMIVGAPGVGKTTLAHQVVLGRLGIQEAVLELPVRPGERVLYLAMDRPKQIAKALARRVSECHEAGLRERLRVWQGPLPATLDKEPDLLAEMAVRHRADTIVVDSLKDAVSTLVDDSLALAYQNARMRALRAGVEIMELHHQRKLTGDAPRDQRPNLDRVYGSTWLTSGAGSVLFIAGESGDPAVTLHHLKSPEGEIGPLPVIHDHRSGTSRVEKTLDPVTLLRQASNGLTTRDLAHALNGSAAPTRAAVEKARRHLDRLVETGLAVKEQGAAGGAGGGQQARYFPSARHISVVS